MIAIDKLRITTWNIRGFNTEREQLNEEIIKQRPQILIIQLKKAWLNAIQKRYSMDRSDCIEHRGNKPNRR